MMKKLLIFVLVLGMASIAGAVPVFQVVDPCDHYRPSDVITIALVDTGVISFSIDAIVDAICIDPEPPIIPAGGYAAEPQIFNAGFGSTFPGVLNVRGNLVEYVQASITSVPPVPVSGILYTFEYHVPEVPASTLICIESLTGGPNGYWAPYFTYVGGGEYEGPVEMLECIHVIPEPATIALLGLGGLLLRRRK